ncbi:MAG: MotA/TolQ/ExbB proton channel family protein [Bacteroidales bacterium]|jgi:biopolymer transport protein ExbB|nr:MotA/TolQ/ExbB proton channel family protein [Bacteroidales bacterium]
MLFHVLQVGLDTAAVEVAENIAKAAEPALQAAPQQVEQSYSLIQMAAKGGWLMIVLAILSVIAIYIFGKKWWMIHKAKQVDKNFMRDIRDYIHEGKVKSALSLCEKYDSPVARLVEKGIERIGRPLTDIQTAVENMGNVEIARLERGLPTLATIAGGAPMIGFLGTVLGMVQAFFNMANAGNNIDITLLSSGIYTAMITTVGGLIVGILAYFGYNYLTAQISNLMFKMETATIDFMDLLHEPADNEEEK